MRHSNTIVTYPNIFACIMTVKFLSQNYAKAAAIKDESRFLGPTASDFKHLIIQLYFTLVCPQVLSFVLNRTKE